MLEWHSMLFILNEYHIFVCSLVLSSLNVDNKMKIRDTDLLNWFSGAVGQIHTGPGHPVAAEV